MSKVLDKPIRIAEPVRDELHAMKKGGDTYNDVIARLIVQFPDWPVSRREAIARMYEIETEEES